MGIRLGFVGAGFIARFHHLMLAGSSADNEIVGVVDADPERARAFAELTGAEVVPTVEELCTQVDAVFVCTWTSAHHEAVAAAVAAGLPVFCEKPLAPSLADATALADLVQRSGVT